MESDRHRFNQGTRFKRNLRAQAVTAVFRDDGAFGESAVAVKTNIRSRLAQLVQTAMTVRTLAARIDGIHSDAISEFYLTNVRSRFYYFARKLVPDY
jgi:hypothetical protein